MNKMMKTLAVAAVAVGIAGAASADASEYKPFADAKALVAKAMKVAETNWPAALGDIRKAKGDLQRLFEYDRTVDKAAVKALCADFDDALAAFGDTGLGDGQQVFREDALFPKCDKMAFDKGFKTAGDCESVLPTAVAVARKYKCLIAAHAISRYVTADECVDLLNEGLALDNGSVRPGWNYGVVKTYAGALQRQVQRKARAYLRKQGKSFVSKDGANPCEAVMTEFVAALNAPYLKGVNEWLEKVGATDRRIDVSKLPTEAEVAQLKEDILNGDKDMNRDYEFILKVCLGVEGYNAFVKEYNGEK